MYNNSENYSNETTIKNSKIIITFYLQNQAMVNKKKCLIVVPCSRRERLFQEVVS